LTRSHSREVSQVALLLYKKIPRIPSVKEFKGLRFKVTKEQSIKPVAEQPRDGGTRRARRAETRTGRRARQACHPSRSSRGQRRGCLLTRTGKMLRIRLSEASCGAFSQNSLSDAG